jgi:hypothetical protein
MIRSVQKKRSNMADCPLEGKGVNPAWEATTTVVLSFGRRYRLG